MKDKKFTLASRLALFGGFLILLTSPSAIFLYRVRSNPGIGLSTTFFMVVMATIFICGLITMVCAVVVNFKPRLKVAFGAIIIVCSLLSAFFVFPLLPLWLGNALGVIGGLWTMLEEKSKIETKEFSKEEHQEINEEEQEELTEEEKRMREEYGMLMEEN